MDNPLGTAFSRVDALKRQLYDMLTNPRDAAAMLGGRIVESGQQAQALQEQTFGDPNRPFRVTDPQAMAKLTDMLMQGPMGFAPAGMINPSVAAKALPNTKAVSENKKPILVYSGAQNEIKQFEEGRNISNVASAYFSNKPDVASAYALDPTRLARGERAPTVYPSYLDLRNPLVIDAKGSSWNKIKYKDKTGDEFLGSTDFLAYLAKQDGYDGLIVKNVKDNPNSTVSGISDVYVPFQPEQIRSATSDPQMAGLLDQPAQKAVEPPKFEMPSFARLQPETAKDIDKIYDFLEEKAKKAGYKIETNSSNVSGSKYLTIYEDLPNDDIRSIELRVSNHADRHPVSYADERISIDPSSVDLEEALYMLQDKGYNLFGK
jgi:hypothetical protein